MKEKNRPDVLSVPGMTARAIPFISSAISESYRWHFLLLFCSLVFFFSFFYNVKTVNGMILFETPQSGKRNSLICL